MADQDVARSVVVTGRVQGVFFRDTCRRVAVAHGVRGWVTNASDGTVHAFLEGAPDAVAAVVAWCHTGPDQARVDAVRTTEEPPGGVVGFVVG